MAQFTFLEVHFEEGSIPVPETATVLGSADDSEPTVADESEGSGGFCPGKLVLGLLVVGVAVAIGWKLLGGNRNSDVGESVADEIDDIDENA